MKRLTLPLSPKDINSLFIGEEVLLSGKIYTARDAAHKRMAQAIENGEPLPIDIKDACIYYAGPTPAKPNQVIGACGPTTSSRMDAFAPTLFDLGLGCTIGKGPLGDTVKQAIKRNNSCYFMAVGGAGALIASTIMEAKAIAYEDLGTEAIVKLVVKDMPVFVAMVRDEDIFDRPQRKSER